MDMSPKRKDRFDPGVRDYSRHGRLFFLFFLNHDMISAMGRA